jgi:hypothetical protein
MTQEVTNVNVLREQGVIPICKAVKVLLQRLNVKETRSALDSCPARPLSASILVRPSLVEPTLSVFQKTMLHGVAANQATQKTMTVSVYPCANLSYVVAMQNA